MGISAGEFGQFSYEELAGRMSTGTEKAAETHSFQAEVAELLRLMVHSVYSLSLIHI